LNAYLFSKSFDLILGGRSCPGGGS